MYLFVTFLITYRDQLLGLCKKIEGKDQGHPQGFKFQYLGAKVGPFPYMSITEILKLENQTFQ